MVGRWLVFACVLGGCDAGTIAMEREDGAVPPDAGMMEMTDAAAPDAESVFLVEVAPLLERRCAACHAPGRTGRAFLTPDPDIYTSVVRSTLINRTDPAASILVTWGAHQGPAWDPTEAQAIIRWVELEAAADPDAEPEYVTEPIEVLDGPNAIALDSFGLSNTRIRFVATRDGSTLILDALDVAAGAEGAELRGPVMLTYRGEVATADAVDRFNGVEVQVPPREVIALGAGSAILTGFQDGDRLGFRFAEVATYAGDPVMPMPTGCQQLAAFTARAQPQFANNCVRCHGGANPTATNAVNMTAISDLSMESQALACGQMLGVLNAAADPARSPIFVSPDPAGGTNHPFRFGSGAALDAFRSEVLAWYSQEGM